MVEEAEGPDVAHEEHLVRLLDQFYVMLLKVFEVLGLQVGFNRLSTSSSCQELLVKSRQELVVHELLVEVADLLYGRIIVEVEAQ